MQNYINSNKIKENKYKILRMSLILGSDDNRAETINNFEESAREIDAMNDETYLSELENKFYDTLKLEEEEQKLAALVDYIGGRVEQRISLLSDFANITGYDLSNLPPIKYYDKLDDYKERLKYIKEYLYNIEQINKLTEEIDESEKQLKEAYLNKASSEEYNGRNEEIIFSKFENIISPIAALKDTNSDNIDAKINAVISNVEDSKKSLDIFEKSYNTLKGSGISYEEEVEYKSYVTNAKEIYYGNKEQEYLLRIYKLLFSKEIEYSTIIVKRDTLNEILNERLELRENLEINENDILTPLYELLEKQYQDIEQQQNNISTIEQLNQLIESKKAEKETFEQANQKVEILSLLREFCIIDTYSNLETPDTFKTEEPIIEKTTPEISEENKLPEVSLPTQEEPTMSQELLTPKFDIYEEKTEEIVKDNQVTSIEEATTLDLDLIHSKASKVMKRVGEMLGIKVEETTIISVTNEEKTEEAPAETAPTDKVTENQPPVIENPLFGNIENPLFNNNFAETTTNSVDPEDDNNFWFSSDMPDALNELPDLEVSKDNFFGDSDIPTLNFPDLKVNFGPNDMEGK